jgi:hypothetical protein
MAMELTKDCIAEICLTALKTDRLEITAQTLPNGREGFEFILRYETSRRIGPGMKNRQEAPETSGA